MGKAEELAAGLLACAGLTSKPMAPSEIASRLGFRVRVKKLAHPDLLGLHVRGSTEIVVAAGLSRERREFTVAHELAESHAPSPAELRGQLRERFCDRTAAALALPARLFLASIFQHQMNLAEMRREWPWASWQALALRVSDLCPGATASNWRSGKLLWRTNASRARVTRTECQAVRRAVREGACNLRGQDGIARAWSLPPDGARSRVVAIWVPAPPLEF